MVCVYKGIGKLKKKNYSHKSNEVIKEYEAVWTFEIIRGRKTLLEQETLADDLWQRFG